MTKWEPVIVRKEVNDEHYYYINDQYFPGVTTILSETMPMPYQLRKWIGDMGNVRAEEKYEQAAARGSLLHNACERLLQGKEIELQLEFPSKRDQKALVGFVNWFSVFQPKIKAVEMAVAHPLRFAGTLDIICTIDGKETIIDIKTSNAIHDSHKLQIAAYKAAYDEMFNTDVNIAILHLNSRTKSGYAYDDKCEIKGEKVTIDDFMKVYKMYEMLNRGIPEPSLENVYPQKLQLVEGGFNAGD